MKYVKEIVIIFGITMVGELLNMFIPLPVPAGVYGLFILLGGLCTKVISLSDHLSINKTFSLDHAHDQERMLLLKGNRLCYG